MNGASTMYHMEKSFKLPEKIDLPTSMYELPKWKGLGSQDPAASNTPNEVLNAILDKKPGDGVAALELRWDTVLQQLSELKSQMSSIQHTMKSLTSTSQPNVGDSQLKSLQGAVINADPASPPYALLLLRHMYKDVVKLSLTCHVHSTVTSLPNDLNSFNDTEYSKLDDSLHMILVWKSGLGDTELVMNPVKQIPIQGEVNILRYLGRLGLTQLGYPSNDLLGGVLMDSTLDTCHRLLHTRTTKGRASLFRNLNAKLGKSQYFGGSEANITDLAAWSALKRISVDVGKDLTQNMAKWYARMGAVLPQ